MANKVVDAFVAVVLVVLFLIGCYGLWDSHNVETRASATRWQPYKPAEPEPLSFWELQDINPDVVGWLDVYGTGIDYPVCYREDMDYYLTHNPMGEYSLTGALFLDRRNKADFSDFSTIVYGHHMQADVQFGPISNFEDAAYFDEHEYGNLYARDRNWGLRFFAYLHADAYDSSVYRTQFESADERGAYLVKLRGMATHVRDVDIAQSERIVLLSTCSSDATNDRTILAAKICDETFANTFITWPNTGTGIDETLSFLGLPWYAWLAVILWVLLLALLVYRLATRTRGGDERERSGPESGHESGPEGDR